MTRTVERLHYPMRLVTKLTGLTSDTIRAWERRYRAVQPERTGGNTRQFSAEDVRRLNLLREATELGHSISSIAGIETDALERLVGGGAESTRENGAPKLEAVAEAYLDSIRKFDARRAMELLRRAAATLEPRTFILEVASPIIHHVGEEWSHGEIGVAHEHLVTAQMLSLLHALPMPSIRQPRRIMLTTPPEHRHEFGILIGGMLAAMRGFEVIHLGPDLPYAEIAWAVQAGRPDYLLFSVVRDMEEAELSSFTANVETLSARVHVWIGCPEDHEVARRGIRGELFSSFESFDQALLAAT